MSIQDAANQGYEKLCWLHVAPFLEKEMERQLELTHQAILRECSSLPSPDLQKIADLAADKRTITRLIGRFKSLCAEPKADGVPIGRT